MKAGSSRVSASCSPKRSASTVPPRIEDVGEVAVDERRRPRAPGQRTNVGEPRGARDLPVGPVGDRVEAQTAQLAESDGGPLLVPACAEGPDEVGRQVVDRAPSVGTHAVDLLELAVLRRHPGERPFEPVVGRGGVHTHGDEPGRPERVAPRIEQPPAGSIMVGAEEAARTVALLAPRCEPAPGREALRPFVCRCRRELGGQPRFQFVEAARPAGPVARRALPELVEEGAARQARRGQPRRFVQRCAECRLAPSHRPLALAEHDERHPVDLREVHTRAACHRLQPCALAQELPPVLVDRLGLHAHARLGVRQHGVRQREYRPAVSLLQPKLEHGQLGGIGEDVRREEAHVCERARFDAVRQAVVLALRLVPDRAGQQVRPLHARAAARQS
jgi:hypothetical protein